MKSILLTLLLQLFILSTSAGNDLTMTLNGSQADRTVCQVDYSNGRPTLIWTDGTTTSNRIGDLMLRLACREGIDKARIGAVSGLQKDDLLIEGIPPSSTLAIYNILGNCLLKRKAAGSVAKLSIKSLNAGIYLLQCQNVVIRFIKQ